MLSIRTFILFFDSFGKLNVNVYAFWQEEEEKKKKKKKKMF